MRHPVSFFAPLLAVAMLALCAGPRAQAQSNAAQTAGNGTYIPTDPLANVRYDNRFDLSLGAAYAHIKAGPPPLQEGSNLGGLDLTASYWFSKRWALEGTGRGYMGTSGAGVNDLNIMGPRVSQYVFAAGPEFLGPHNKHGALIVHALMGGAYGNFESDLQGNPPSTVEFFNNQVVPSADTST
jgi:hypothetical protein